MKKTFLFMLIFLPACIIFALYLLDKEYFLCPVEYKRDMVIRCDSRGEGFFAAGRNGNRLHQGIDLFAKVGTPVVASRAGKAAVAEQSRGMGKYVTISHPDGIITLYGHLSEVYVRNDEFVRQGRVIGSVGKTGNANFRDIQPHLHFEVRKNGLAQDPLQYLE